MMFRSAVLSVFLLALSLSEAEADVYHRRTRGGRFERPARRKLGIGISSRAEAGKVGSKVGPPKTGGGAYGITTDAPTASAVNGRVPILNIIKTKAPKPTQASDSGVDGRLDITGGGGDSQTVIGVNGGEGSNTFDNIPGGNDDKDDLDQAFEDLFNINNGGDSTSTVGEGGDEPEQPNAPNGDGQEDGNGEGTDGDSSSVTGESTGVSGSDGDSDAETTDGSVSESDGSANGDSTGDEGTTEESGSENSGSAAVDSTEDSTGVEGATEGSSSGVTGSGVGGTDGEASDASGVTGDAGDNSDTNDTTDSDPAGSGTDGGSTGTDVTGDNSDASDPAGSGTNGGSTGTDGEGFDPTNGGSTEWGTAPDDDFIPDESTAVFCPNVPTDKEVLINWIYAVEFEPDLSNEEKSQAVAILELKLVSEILQCNAETPIALPGKRFVRRHLVEDGIAGLNYMPLDARNENVVCYFSNNNSTNSGVCETYFGRMEMYLQEEADEEFAIISMLYKIRDAMQRTDFPGVDGITRVWYLDPDLSGADGISGGGSITDGPVNGSYSTGTMIAFAALGVSVFAALVLGAFRMRRNEEDVITNFDSTVTGGESKQGAFVMPNSYKLDSVPESDDDSRYNGSVIVSEGGFTSDGDSQLGDAAYASNYDNVLGSNTEDDDDMNNDMILQNNTDFSEYRKSTHVAADDVGLGVRHSGVDVHQCTSANCKICNYQPKEVEFIHKSPTTPNVATGNFFGEE